LQQSTSWSAYDSNPQVRVIPHCWCCLINRKVKSF